MSLKGLPYFPIEEFLTFLADWRKNVLLYLPSFRYAPIPILLQPGVWAALENLNSKHEGERHEGF